MTKSKILFSLLLLLTSYGRGFSQYVETYLSIQGTWDKVRDVKRARFAGNNLLLNKHFSDQYFSKRYYSHLISLSGSENVTINVTGQLVFRVKINNIDSIRVVNSSGFSAIDSLMISMLRSSSGKWIPGKVDGNVLQEEITIWIHIFSGNVKDRTMGTCLIEGNQYFEEGNYGKAIKAYNEVLHYDELNTNATTKKGLALIKINKVSDACSLWNSFEKYQTIEISTLQKENYK